MPVLWVVEDVLANAVEGFRVADDVFVVVPLPEAFSERRPSARMHGTYVLNGDHGFVRADHITQCRGNPCGCPIVDGDNIEGRHKACPYNGPIIHGHIVVGRHKTCPYNGAIIHGISSRAGTRPAPTGLLSLAITTTP